MLEVRGLTVKIGNSLTLVDNVSFKVEENQWLMIVGPNGAGKSTILHAITQEMPYEGEILTEGVDIRHLKPVQRARKIGALRQKNHVGYAFSVKEVVRMGRYSYSPGLFASKDVQEEEMVDQALELVGLKEIENQSVLTLSGGELQRTFLAQILTQDPDILILDEPTNHLDMVYQRQVFELVNDWVRQPGKAVISVVHDLSLAQRYGTHMMMLNKGKIVALGSASEVIVPEKVDQVYHMDVYEWMHQLYAVWDQDRSKK